MCFFYEQDLEGQVERQGEAMDQLAARTHHLVQENEQVGVVPNAFVGANIWSTYLSGHWCID